MNGVDVSMKYIAVILWLSFCVWTVWTLSKRNVRGLGVVYTFGVKGYGLWMWGLSTPVAVAMVYRVNPGHSLFYYGVVFGLLLLPICLWGGYLFGVAMNGFSPTRPGK
jgi:hypothetical protein